MNEELRDVIDVARGLLEDAPMEILGEARTLARVISDSLDAVEVNAERNVTTALTVILLNLDKVVRESHSMEEIRYKIGIVLLGTCQMLADLLDYEEIGA